MEGATKWDPTSWKTASEDVNGGLKNEHASVISALESELERARARVHDLETERRLSKTKLERFLQRLTDERSAWRHREHEKLRAAVDDVKRELNRERQNRQRMEIVNSKLVNELADTRLSAKRYLRDYEKERKSRELIEEVCDELAKEIGEDKVEVEALKRESVAMRAEADEERRMLQMAEVWREERVQMKLVDARVALEDKYAQMNGLVAGLEVLLRTNATGLGPEEIGRAETLRRAAASIEIQEIVDFKYEPANPDDIFSVFEDLSFEPPEVPIDNRNVYFDDEDDDDDESGWETASRLDDDSPVPSVTKTCVTEIVEVGSKRPEKAYSWRPENYKMISMEGTEGGRFSDLDRSSGLSPSGSGEPWSSPDSGQWSRGVVQKHSLKSKLLEARMESQKVQLRQVLKQKI